MKLICEAIAVRGIGRIADGAGMMGEETEETTTFPTSFVWRGRLYRVRGVLVRWRWRGAWWTTPTLLGHQRIYFQVLCAAPGDSEVCMELFCEHGCWTLSRLLD